VRARGVNCAIFATDGEMWLFYLRKIALFCVELARPVDRGFAIGSRGDVSMLFDNVENEVLRGVCWRGLARLNVELAVALKIVWTEELLDD
jgi:hypothetical protein